MGNRNRIITVFGGSGFIGRHLIKRLTKLEGTTIRVACRHPNRTAYLRPSGDIGQIVPMATDIFDNASVARAVAGADAVINLIGILYEKGRWTFQGVHAEAPGQIARAAVAAGASRLIHVSAIGADRNSASGYARSKAIGELEVFGACPDATILRPSIIFGPEDDFFNRFGSMARLSPVLPLIGGGHTRFQPVYVGDVAEAIMVALADPKTKHRTYELGGPQVYSFRRLLEIMMVEIRRQRRLVSIPWWLASLEATFLEKLPNPPLTRDQVEMLKKDNVVGGESLNFKDLGLSPTSLEMILPSYLDRFRPGGRFCRTQLA